MIKDNKTCTKCNVEKSTESFYYHLGMADNHFNKCKECCKEYNRMKHIKRKIKELISMNG